MPELLFHGAAGEVTGSMHMVFAGRRCIALDCGLFQGRRMEAEEKNREWPVDPSDISAVILSHAHIDHAGRLPRLARDGFTGPIYTTAATRDLCAIMLADSAHVQLEDVPYVNKRRREHGLPPVEPLYGPQEAKAVMRQFVTVSYERPFPVVNGVTATFTDAGHMLGSASVRLVFPPTGRSLLFSGDVGQPRQPILQDPSRWTPSDVVICESTYGARIHPDTSEAAEITLDAVRRTIDRGGKVIVPAFAVGRTQLLVYFLVRAFRNKKLPRTPIYIDSPLAVRATDIYKLHPDCFDADARAFQERYESFLDDESCTYITEVEDSKRLNTLRGPCIIIAASGMCEAGRIRHHLKNHLGEKRNTILIPGFQARHTLGRRLVDGVDHVNIFHEEIPVRAEVIQVHGFSGHADQAQLLRQLAPLRDSTKRVHLVHGEPEQSGVLADKLREAGFDHAELAYRGQRVEF